LASAISATGTPAWFFSVPSRRLRGGTTDAESGYAPALRLVIDDYLTRSRVTLRTGREAETLALVISLVLSTPGVSLLPAYARKLLPASVVSRPLQGEAPTIDLAIGHNS
jgi:LysR family transcriptional regulator, hca operon transcriptional activator